MTYLLIWLAWCLAGGSPGPATMAIAGTGMQYGRASALAVSAGILAGSASWGLAAVLGVGAIMMTNVWLFEILRYLGAAYLLYLAFKSARAALRSSQSTKEKSLKGGNSALFRKGALLHLTNPKAVLNWGSVFTLILPADASSVQLFSMFLLLFSGSVVVFIGYAFLFSSAPMVAGYKRLQRWFEGVFALFFGFASLKILTARLTP